jgi:hypothetical protein
MEVITMSEEKIETSQEQAAEQEPNMIIDGQPVHVDGTVLNLLVGIRGSNVYRVTSTAGDVHLQDFIEGLGTVELNIISSSLEKDAVTALKEIQVFNAMKNEIVKAGVGLLLEHTKDMPEDIKAEIEAVYGITSDEKDSE